MVLLKNLTKSMGHGPPYPLNLLPIRKAGRPMVHPKNLIKSMGHGPLHPLHLFPIKKAGRPSPQASPTFGSSTGMSFNICGKKPENPDWADGLKMSSGGLTPTWLDTWKALEQTFSNN